MKKYYKQQLCPKCNEKIENNNYICQHCQEFLWFNLDEYIYKLKNETKGNIFPKNKYKAYFENKNKVYFVYDNFVYYILNGMIKADANSFQITENNHIAKDKNHIFFYGEKTNYNFDVESFEMLATKWGKDKNYAYYFKKFSYNNIKKIEVDIKTFVVKNEGLYAQDKNYIYYEGEKITNFDIASFSAVENDNTNHYFEDKNGTYYIILVDNSMSIKKLNNEPKTLKIYDNQRFVYDNNFVYFKDSIVTIIDGASFNFLMDDFIQDKYGIYQIKDHKNKFKAIKINVDKESFSSIGGDLYKDNFNVFFKEDKLDQFDSKTFCQIAPNYFKDKNGGYFSEFGDNKLNWVNLEADIESIFWIKGGDENVILKDKNFIYYEGIKYDNINGATFELLNNYYAKDKNGVYYYISYNTLEKSKKLLKFTKLLADVNSFYVHESGLGIDKDHIFSKEEIIINVHVPSFECVKSFYYKDKNHIYYFQNFLLSIISHDSKNFKCIKENKGNDLQEFYGLDSANVYYQGKKIKEADPKTFELINSKNTELVWAKDEKNVYLLTNKIAQIDPETFHVLYHGSLHGEILLLIIDKNGLYKMSWRDINFPKIEKVEITPPLRIIDYYYYKDKEAVYYLGEKIDGVDYASFCPLDDMFAKDKGHVFCQGKLVKNCHPLYFQRLNLNFFRDHKSIFFKLDEHQAIELKSIDYASFEIVPSFDCIEARDKNKEYDYHYFKEIIEIAEKKAEKLEKKYIEPNKEQAENIKESYKLVDFFLKNNMYFDALLILNKHLDNPQYERKTQRKIKEINKKLGEMYQNQIEELMDFRNKDIDNCALISVAITKLNHSNQLMESLKFASKKIKAGQTDFFNYDISHLKNNFINEDNAGKYFKQYFNQGDCLLLLAKYLEKIEAKDNVVALFYDQILKVYPTCLSAILSKIKTLNKQGKEYLSLVNLALKTHHNDKNLLKYKILYLHNKQKYDEVLLCINDYLTVYPNSDEILCIKAESLSEKKKHLEALLTLKKIKKIDEKKCEFCYKKDYYKNVSYNHLRLFTLAFLKKDPQNQCALTALANCYIKQKRYKQAKETFDIIIQLPIYYQNTHKGKTLLKAKIDACNELGNYNNSLEIIRGVINSNPTSTKFLQKWPYIAYN